MNRLKDIFYESLDYIIILAIVIVIGVVIGWRLNVLFKNKPLAEKENTEKSVSIANKTPDISYDEPEDKTIPPDETPALSNEPVKIIVVDDSTWSDAAKQLSARNLISKEEDFIQTVNELKLQDKLKCRTFYLNANESLEKYALILAGQVKDASPEKVGTKIVEVTVPAGASWDKVAAELLKLNAISDKRAFLSEVTRLKLESKLQPGTYELKTDYTLEDIVKVLCKKN